MAKYSATISPPFCRRRRHAARRLIAECVVPRIVPKDSRRAPQLADLQAAQGRWRAVNGPYLVALVRAAARFEKGKLADGTIRPDTRQGGRRGRRQGRRVILRSPAIHRIDDSSRERWHAPNGCQPISPSVCGGSARHADVLTARIEPEAQNPVSLIREAKDVRPRPLMLGVIQRVAR